MSNPASESPQPPRAMPAVETSGSRAPRRSPVFALLAVVGGVTLAGFVFSRWYRRRRVEEESSMKDSIEIDADAASVYSVIKQFNIYPCFMSFVRSVEPSEDGHLHWTLEGPAGIRLGWDARLTELTPLRSIAWESLPNPLLSHAGRFELEEISPQKTRLHAELRFGAPFGKTQLYVARILGMDPRSRFHPDLERLKQRVECGEAAAPPRALAHSLHGRGMRERTGDQSRAGPRRQTSPDSRRSSREANS